MKRVISSNKESTKTGIENRMKVFLAVAKQPSSFQELLRELGKTRPTLLGHLKTLQKRGSVYRDTIKPDEGGEVGKVVYRASVHHIPRMLDEALSLYDVLSESFKIKANSKPRTVEETTTEEEIKKVHAELERLKKKMAEVVQDYLERRQVRISARLKERE